MTTMCEAPASFHEIDPIDPVFAGILAIEEIRTVQIEALSAAQSAAVQSLSSLAEVAERRVQVRESARANMAERNGEIVAQYARSFAATLPEAVRAANPQLTEQITTFFASFDTTHMESEAEFYAGTQNPDDSWGPSGREQLEHGLREIFVTPVVETGEPSAEEPEDDTTDASDESGVSDVTVEMHAVDGESGDETHNLEEEHPFAFIPGFGPGEGSEREREPRLGSRERVQAAFAWAKDALNGAVVRVQNTAASLLEQKAKLGVETDLESAERSRRRRIVTRPVGAIVLAAAFAASYGATTYFLHKSGNTHAIPEFGFTGQKNLHNYIANGQLGGFSTPGEHAAQAVHSAKHAATHAQPHPTSNSSTRHALYTPKHAAESMRPQSMNLDHPTATKPNADTGSTTRNVSTAKHSNVEYLTNFNEQTGAGTVDYTTAEHLRNIGLAATPNQIAALANHIVHYNSVYYDRTLDPNNLSEGFAVHFPSPAELAHWLAEHKA